MFIIPDIIVTRLLSIYFVHIFFIVDLNDNQFHFYFVRMLLKQYHVAKILNVSNLNIIRLFFDLMF